MIAKSHDLYNEGSEEPSTTDGVIKLVKRFFLKSVGWVGIYLLGYYNLSIAWLLTPLLLTVLRSQWKSERNQKLSAAREAALADEKTMIESRIRVEDLPSWVFFPDKVIFFTCANCIVRNIHVEYYSFRNHSVHMSFRFYRSFRK